MRGLSWGRAKAVAIALLVLLGGLVLPVVGWLAGAVLVWVLPEYSRTQRLLAILAPPGGLASTAVVYEASSVGRVCRGSAPPGVHAVLSCVSQNPALPRPIIILLFFGTFIAALYTFVHLCHPAKAKAEPHWVARI